MFFSVLSCRKNDNTSISYQEGIETSRSFVSGQHLMTLLLNTYFKSITDSVLMVDGKNNIDGAVVTFESNVPQKLRIKYPDWGADDGYGYRRAGTYEALTATFFNDPQGIIDFDFTDFVYVYTKNDSPYPDSLWVGQMAINNLGKPNGTDNQYLIEVENSRYVYGDSTGVLTFNMEQYFERLKEPGTVYYSPNDKFNIWGGMTGTSANDYDFEAIINSENYLRNEFSCNWLKRGPTIINSERFKYESLVCFPGVDSCQNELLSDSCENQYVVIVDENPFPYPFDD